MEHCDRCGNQISTNELVIFYQNDKVVGICQHCESLMGTCYTCVHRTKCDFKDSPLKIPFTTVKEIRQGNTIFRQEVQNPDRIRETCQKGCTCFSTEFGCLRQINQTCGNYKEEPINGTI